MISALATLAIMSGAATAGSFPPVATSVALADTRPNIVLIVTDDQRWDTLWFMPQVESQLVQRGVTFSNAMTPTSLCCPSRATILTGRFAHSTHVWSNASGTGSWTNFKKYGNESSTIATWLHDTGYRTGLVGKYLNKYNKAPLGYVPPGWDTWRAFRTAGQEGAAYYSYDLTNGSGPSTHYGSAPTDYSTDVLGGLALDFIDETPTTTPLFLYFAPFSPHAPFTIAPRYQALAGAGPFVKPPNYNEADVSDKPRWLRDRPLVANQAGVRLKQLRSLRAVDDQVGAIIDALRSSGRLDNSLLVFMTDNGYMWGEHRLREKNEPYDAATRIPLVLRWDGHIAAGSVDPRLALNVDIAQTLAEAAGASAPGTVEGESLLEPPVRSGFVLEAWKNVPNRAPPYCGYRTLDYLFVHYDGGDEEFYDYRSDPFELNNLAYDPAYRTLVDSFRERSRLACSPTPPNFSWTSDTRPPRTVIDDGPSSPTSETTATFAFSADETGVSFECSLDGAAFDPCASGIAYDALADGDHTVVVRAIDAAGNVGPDASWPWTIAA